MNERFVRSRPAQGILESTLDSSVEEKRYGARGRRVALRLGKKSTADVLWKPPPTINYNQRPWQHSNKLPGASLGCCWRRCGMAIVQRARTHLLRARY